jgi:hypothetical protein
MYLVPMAGDVTVAAIPAARSCSRATNPPPWAHLAGEGSDPHGFGGTPRHFDIERQVRLYDPHESHHQRQAHLCQGPTDLLQVLGAESPSPPQGLR